MTTTVVNIRTGARCDVYIGRAQKPSEGIFGNPFVIGRDGDRDEVLRKYKIHFEERLKMDREFKLSVEKLKGKILGCFCRPPSGFEGKLLCHGQVIAGYLDGIPPENIP